MRVNVCTPARPDKKCVYCFVSLQHVSFQLSNLVLGVATVSERLYLTFSKSSQNPNQIEKQREEEAKKKYRFFESNLEKIKKSCGFAYKL